MAPGVTTRRLRTTAPDNDSSPVCTSLLCFYGLHTQGPTGWEFGSVCVSLSETPRIQKSPHPTAKAQLSMQQPDCLSLRGRSCILKGIASEAGEHPFPCSLVCTRAPPCLCLTGSAAPAAVPVVSMGLAPIATQPNEWDFPPGCILLERPFCLLAGSHSPRQPWQERLDTCHSP